MKKRKLPIVIRNKVTGTIYKLVSYNGDIVYTLAYINEEKKLCSFLVNHYGEFAYDVMFRQLDNDVNWEVVKK